MEYSKKFIDKFIGGTLSDQTNRNFFQTLYWYMVDSTERTRRRLDKHIQRQLDDPHIDLIKTGLRLSKSTIDETAISVLKYVKQRVDYVREINNYNKREYWADAYETWLSMRGDCDDINLLIHVLCRLAGIPTELLFSVLGEVNPELHYWSIYFSPKTGKWYALDGTYFYDSTKIQYRVPFQFTNKRYRSIWYIFNEKYIYKQRDEV